MTTTLAILTRFCKQLREVIAVAFKGNVPFHFVGDKGG